MSINDEFFHSRPSDADEMTDEDDVTEQLSALGMHEVTGAPDDEEEEVKAVVKAVPDEDAGPDALIAEEKEEEKEEDGEEALDELKALDRMAQEYRKDDSLIIGVEEEI